MFMWNVTFLYKARNSKNVSVHQRHSLVKAVVVNMKQLVNVKYL